MKLEKEFSLYVLITNISYLIILLIGLFSIWFFYNEKLDTSEGLDEAKDFYEAIEKHQNNFKSKIDEYVKESQLSTLQKDESFIFISDNNILQVYFDIDGKPISTNNTKRLSNISTQALDNNRINELSKSPIGFQLIDNLVFFTYFVPLLNNRNEIYGYLYNLKEFDAKLAYNLQTNLAIQAVFIKLLTEEDLEHNISIIQGLEKEGFYSKFLSKKFIRTFFPIKSIENKYIALIGVDTYRTYGTILERVLIFTLYFVLIFMTLSYLSIKRKFSTLVLDPLKNIEKLFKNSRNIDIIETREFLDIEKNKNELSLLTEVIEEISNEEGLKTKQLKTMIEERTNNLEEVNKNLKLFENIVETTSEGIVITDLDGKIVHANSAFIKLSDYSKEELIGQNPRLLKSHMHSRSFYEDMWISIKKNGIWEGEVWNKKKSGELYPKWLIINTLYDTSGNPINYIGLNTDLSKLKLAENKIKELSQYDDLTGLPNRNSFRTLLYKRLKKHDAENHSLAVLFIDFDNLKYLNENYNLDFGDLIIKFYSDLINDSIQEYGVLARYAGDKFVAYVDFDEPESLSTLLNQILEYGLHEQYIDGIKVKQSFSIGVSTYPLDDKTVEGLISKAEAALYAAKSAGKAIYKFFFKELEEKLKFRIHLENELREAIESNQFELFYQPQVNLDKFIAGEPSIIGCEALIRWRSSSGKLISPIEFIPIAEETGLILPIGRWVIYEGCRAASEWLANGKGIRVSVNVSTLQFEDPLFIDTIDDALERYNLPSKYLHLEITESSILQDTAKAQEILAKLKSRNIEYSLDDFGTGYSSLSYIRELEASNLKIDRSFILRIQDSKKDKSLVQVIISIAKLFQMISIAEGVETLADLKVLYDIGCDEIQGYYISKPLPKEEFERFYEEFNSKSHKHLF